MHWDGEEHQVFIVQKSFPKGGQTLLSLPSPREKNFSFYFQHNYLTICVVEFCEFFCTCFPSSLGQNPTVESEKKSKKFIWASSTRNGSFWGVFLRKKGLSWCLVHVDARHIRAHLCLCAYSVRAHQYSSIDHIHTHLSNDVEDMW